MPMINRRAFSGALSAALFAPSASGAGKLALHIGHTGLTWIPLGGRLTPPPPINPMVDPQYVQAAIRDIAGLGFYGIELFGNQIEAMEAQGGVGALLEQAQAAAHLGLLLDQPLRSRGAQGCDRQDRWFGRSW